MKMEWTTLVFAGMISCTAMCAAQEESRPQWDCAGDNTCCDEESELVQTERPRHDRDYFMAPHFYDRDYERGYKEPVPAPDWPGANDLLMDQLSR